MEKLFHKIKQKPFLKWYLKPFQQFYILLLEGSFLMMFLLVENIFYYRIDMRLRIRENTITFLPIKFALLPNSDY